MSDSAPTGVVTSSSHTGPADGDTAAGFRAHLRRWLSDTVDVDAEVGVGRLLVLVPAGARVTGEAEAGVGELLQVLEDGRRRELNPDDDTEVSRRFVFDGSVEGPRVELDLEVGMGQIEVRRVAS